MNRRGSTTRRGAALLLCMVFTAAVMTPLTVLALRTTGHMRHAQYAQLESAALAGAEAALALAKSRLEAGESGSVGYEGFLNWSENGSLQLTHFPDGVQAETFPGTPTIRWITVAREPDRLPDRWAVVYAIAQAGSVTRCVEGVFKPLNDGTLERVSWRELPMQSGEGDLNAAL